MEPKTIAFHHFGCKVNFAEASALSRQFKDKGFQLKEFREMADVYVISTCVVTAVAEKKCRAAIRQAHSLNPEAKIAVIGCFPELMPDELKKYINRQKQAITIKNNFQDLKDFLMKRF